MPRVSAAAAAILSMAALLGLAAVASAQYDPAGDQARQLTAERGLFLALADNNIASMAALRDQKADPNVTLARVGLKPNQVFASTLPIFKQPFNTGGWPILTWATYLNNEAAMNLLLRAGARVNATDEYGATALHWAAWAGRHSLAKQLLNNGANCQARDFKNRTPKDWALMAGQTDMLRLLDGRTCKVVEEPDSDGDGVPDSLDLCPGTPLGAPVDERGCWIVAYAAFFDFNRAVIKREFLPYIEQTARILTENPDIPVYLVGHTDYIGSDSYNYDLGLRRAMAVRDALGRYGVDTGRLQTSSEGETQPIADNRTSSGRARNRRVELHVDQSRSGDRASLQ
ncbi:MAG: OmpA family protein [Deltaproteobacteria bacterium]|jgi:outer membrane protein OmpA-like peptidoglycan-associated protein|nr:OmpA family protein [Deltaproteobacteria bacterium]